LNFTGFLRRQRERKDDEGDNPIAQDGTNQKLEFRRSQIAETRVMENDIAMCCSFVANAARDRVLAD
jgi:hypothetical protein